jgi:hypothetical protein
MVPPSEERNKEINQEKKKERNISTLMRNRIKENEVGFNSILRLVCFQEDYRVKSDLPPQQQDVPSTHTPKHTIVYTSTTCSP